MVHEQVVIMPSLAPRDRSDIHTNTAGPGERPAVIPIRATRTG